MRGTLIVGDGPRSRRVGADLEVSLRHRLGWCPARRPGADGSAIIIGYGWGAVAAYGAAPDDLEMAPGSTDTLSRVNACFDDCVGQIDDAYRRLNHRLGWRFLYSPAATLSPEASLVFAGLNPGGSVYEAPLASVEQGNAYRIERWGANGQPNQLQQQIGILYRGISERLGSSSVELYDSTLAVNFCPFRSPSWEDLAERQASVAFSRGLWRQILQTVRPKLIVCLGGEAAKNIAGTLTEAGATRGPEEQIQVGWGTVTYSVTPFENGSTGLLLVRLPHLSRFAFLGRSQSAIAAEGLYEKLRSALSG